MRAGKILQHGDDFIQPLPFILYLAKYVEYVHVYTFL